MEEYNKNGEEEQEMFLTLAAPSLPVALAPKSFQVWRETTTQPQPSDSNLTVLDSSGGGGGNNEGDQSSSSADQPPKKLGFINYEVEPGLSIRLRHNINHDMDPRKLKRVISNRVSAQKSRIKKLQYVADLEKKQKELEVAVLRPQVAIAREHKRFVEMEQRELNLRIAACQQHFRQTEGEIEAKKEEMTRVMRKLAREEEEEASFILHQPSSSSSSSSLFPYYSLLNMPPPNL